MEDQETKICETREGFSVIHEGQVYPPLPTPHLHEVAALLEMLQPAKFAWRFSYDIDDPEVLDDVTETIQAVGAFRRRLQHLRMPREDAFLIG